MNIFQLIKRVLDGEFDRIVAPTRAQRLTLVNQRHEELTKAYAGLTDDAQEPPDYSDATTRFAYIYKYTTCHADMVFRSIDGIEELAELFEGNDWLRVACVGGGPGSDFLGVLKYALRTGREKSLKCFLLDRESAWGDTWCDMEEHTDALSFNLSTHFQQLDVTDPATWATQTKYRSAHLFTFVYFLSEVYRFDDQAQGFFRSLVENAHAGAFFLFVENNSAAFRTQIHRFEHEYGLRVVRAGAIDYVTDIAEEKKDLNPYFSELRDNPKIRANIYRVLMVKG